MKVRPACLGFILIVLSAPRILADPEIVIAIRYLQAQGTSHSHLYLYREDGKFLRQLTNDNSGQDVDPIFAPDGETIVFSREHDQTPLEYWSVTPLGGGLKKLPKPPDWYADTRTSPYFTNRDLQQPPEATPSPGATASPAEQSPQPNPATPTPTPQSYKAPDESVELILREDPSDEEDQYDGSGHGKHYLLRDLKSGTETEFGKLPGFLGAFEILHQSRNRDQTFLFDGSLRMAFFGLHLNSTDGDTCFALDLNGSPRLVDLSPNWAAPIPLLGESAFLSLTENRYVPIPASKKTANCSYLERWDVQLNKVRYARPSTAAICYGASIYRPGLAPAIVTIRRNAD